jgi:hypothetical protein
MTDITADQMAREGHCPVLAVHGATITKHFTSACSRAILS